MQGTTVGSRSRPRYGTAMHTSWRGSSVVGMRGEDDARCTLVDVVLVSRLGKEADQCLDQDKRT